jgi:hypothetical protein
MKYLALVLGLLVCTEVTAQTNYGWLVYADSQAFVVQDTGDARHNWPYLLQTATGRHFMNLSRGGRRLADGFVADHLRSADVHPLNQEVKGIIIALGSLDAIFEMDPTYALIDAVQEAESRDLDVICLLPPDNKIMVNDDIRYLISSICPETIDMSLYVGPDLMVDQVHFGQHGHGIYATSLLWAMVIRGKFLD